MSGASSGQNGIVVSRRRGKDTRQNAAIVKLPSTFAKVVPNLCPFGAGRSISSFYISYRGFHAATRPPGAPRDPGSPSQALWVGGDRAWPPCPRSGRSRSTQCGAQSAMGARKGRRSGSANYTRLAPPACSEPPERVRIDTGPAQRQLCDPGGHVPRRHRTLQEEVRPAAQKG